MADQEAVFFGGRNGTVATNQTWVFVDGAWVNDTNPSQAPPARYGAAMAYDNETGVDAVVLFGGCDPAGACPMNDTWVFTGGSWRNITAEAGSPPTLSEATMASWGLNGTILYGGCENSGCGNLSSATWTFQNTTTCQALYHYPCWSRVPQSGPSPPGLAGAALSDWPEAGSLSGSVVLYGGFNGSCATCRVSDATWLLNGGSWENITATYSPNPYPSTGGAFGSFFWDPVSNELYLYQSVRTASGSLYGELWTTNVYTWANESTWTLPTPSRIGANVAGLTDAAGTVTPLRTLLLGGEDATGAVLDGQWVFEPSIVNRVNIAPNPVESNATASFFGNVSGGTSPAANWTTGDGGVIDSANGTHVYRTLGTFSARFTAADLYGVRNTTTLPVNVYTFLANLSAPSVADQGVPAQFGSVPINATGPCTYNWTFSDGTTATDAHVPHVFLSAGPASVTLSVRDATGTVVNETVPVQVNPALKASASANPSTFDVDVSTNLQVAATEGTPPYVVVWTLPGNRNFTGPSTSYLPRTAGVANISVVVTDAVGGTWADTLSLTVNPSLQFTVSTSSNAASLGRSVSFSTQVQGGTSPYTYAWEFGDGGSSSASSPVHTYPRSGTFTVAVWVNDSGGGSFRQTVEVKIPRTSGGLLWVILALPTLELLLFLIVIALFVTVLALAVHHWRNPPRPPTPPPGATGHTKP